MALLPIGTTNISDRDTSGNKRKLINGFSERTGTPEGEEDGCVSSQTSPHVPRTWTACSLLLLQSLLAKVLRCSGGIGKLERHLGVKRQVSVEKNKGFCSR